MVSLTALRAVTTVLNGLAQILTGAKLEYRRRNRKFWVDDVLSAFAAVCSFLVLVCFWIVTVPLESNHGPSQISRFRASWILCTSTILVIWLSQLSILLTCLRIIPRGNSCRLFSYLIAISIALMGIAVFTLKVFYCVHDNSWALDPNPVCPSHRLQEILRIGFELLGDVLLIAFPFTIIFSAKGKSLDRSLFYGVIGIGTVLLASTTVHVVYVLTRSEALDSLTGSIEIALFLMATNVPSLIEHVAPQQYPSSRSPVTSNIRGKIGMPTKLHSMMIWTPPETGDSKKHFLQSATTLSHSPSISEEQHEELNFSPTKVSVIPPPRPYSAGTESMSQYSVNTPLQDSSFAKQQLETPKGAPFLAPPSVSRNIVSTSSYSSLFSKYLSDEQPGAEPSDSDLLVSANQQETGSFVRIIPPRNSGGAPATPKSAIHRF